MPAFLSILTVTECSWLQKRHEKMTGRVEPFFLGAGFLVAFLRLPWVDVRRGVCLETRRGYHFDLRAFERS